MPHNTDKIFDKIEMGEVFSSCRNAETALKGNSIIFEENPPINIVRVDSSNVSCIVGMIILNIVHPSIIE